MSAPFTAAEIIEMVKSGLSVDDIARLQGSVAAPVATPAASPKAGAPEWLIARGERKAARRDLAATLRRDLGRDFTADEWKAAKVKAGIAKAEKAAHKAFVAAKAAKA